MGMRIAVTGANGFIGRHLVRHLSVGGYAVAAGWRGTRSTPREWQDLPGVEVVQLDGTAGGFDRLMEGAEAVIHLAGLAAAPRGSDAEQALRAANVDLTQEVVAAALRCGVRRFIHLSSIRAVVGASANAIISDNTVAVPVEAYGRSKLQSEQRVAAFAGSGRFAVSLRPPLVIGADAGGNWQRLQRLAASKAWMPFAGIRNRRSYLAVQSLCEALAHLAGRDWPAELSGAYCLADGEALSLAEVITALRTGMGQPPKLFAAPGLAVLRHLPVVGGAASSLLGSLEIDAGRFREVFAFQPSRSIKEAIAVSGTGYVGSQNISV